eukprot:scaffold2919_cov161-Amphora_coffeaeformis.AAC.6
MMIDRMRQSFSVVVDPHLLQTTKALTISILFPFHSNKKRAMRIRVLSKIVLFLVCEAWTASAFSSSLSSSSPPRVGAVTTTSQLWATSVTKQNCDICVMGGGFGGLYTALSIASRQDKRSPLNIVLVDESDRFVFLPLLYDLVEGTATRQEVCPTYKEILKGTNIHFVQGTLKDVMISTSPNTKDSLSTATIADAVNPSNTFQVSFRQGVLAVGATPQSILNKVPGATNYTQPFYTQDHALQTRSLLQQLEQRQRDQPNQTLKVAVVGGGYGGVELAACLQRRFGRNKGQVTLLARSPPLQGTRAEPVVQQALTKLGVQVEICRVNAVEPVDSESEESFVSQHPRVKVRRTAVEKEEGVAAADSGDDEVWDAVFWTAGSGPAEPVSDPNALIGLERIEGRLATDRSLRCYGKGRSVRSPKPPLWALGDCATAIGGDPVPKTAQAAMQQSDVVAYNVLLEYASTKSVSRRMTRETPKTFAYQDLGSMMMLGGPNGVIAAPPDGSTFGPLFAPLIDTARLGLGMADSVLKQQQQKSSPLANLSLGGYGLGVDDDPSKTQGSLAGTLAGAARRAVYAARMPTNRQRVYSAASAALNTALTLAKEAAQQKDGEGNDDIMTQ